MAKEGLVFDESVANRCRPVVIPEWTDYNDHFNVAYYAQAFDMAFDTFLADTAGDDVRTLPVTSKTDYLQEVAGGRELTITTQILSADDSHLHVLQAMYDGPTGPLAAIQERIDRFRDGATPSPGRLSGDALDTMNDAAARHASLSIPDGWGALST